MRRSLAEYLALYVSQIRRPQNICVWISQIAVPGGGPAMRGGVQARLVSVRLL